MLKRIVWCATGAMAVTSASVAQPSSVRLDVNADRVGELNALIRVPGSVIDISGELMPALASMTPARRGWSMFMSDRTPGFEAAKAWARGDTAQHAISVALEQTDPEDTRAIGLPYGAQGVDPAWVNAGVSATMDGGLIYSMQFGYLDRIEDLMLAMSVDAWAKAMEGDGDGVRELIVAWVRLGRIVADREMADEKRFAYEMIQAAVERLRDIVYSFPELYDEAGYVELIEDLDNRDLELDAVRLPRGDRLEALQLIERTMVPEGGVDPAKFGVLLAGGGVDRDRPLELFGRTAQMNTLGARHEGWFRTFDELNKIYGDWWTRWETPDFHDTQLTRSPDYAAMDRGSFAMLEQTMGEVNDLFNLRMDTLTELFGTRSAMGVKAFEAKNNRFPPALAAVSPSFVSRLDVDPWSIQARFGGGRGGNVPRERFEKSDIFRFLVPIRDQRWGPREEKVPYAVEVTTGEVGVIDGGDEAMPEGETDAMPAGEMGSSFTVSFTQDTFLLYSVWKNKADDGTRVVGPEGTDLLIWPPFESLKRAQAGY